MRWTEADLYCEGRPSFDDRYDLLLADPPWRYADEARAGNRGAVCHYPVLGLDEICRLDVGGLAKADSVLALWATCPLLPEALRVMDSWGFEFVTVGFCWVKPRRTPDPEAERSVLAAMASLGVEKPSLVWRVIQPWMTWRPRRGMGHHTRANVEFVLFGRRGAGLGRVDRGIGQVIVEPLGQHSAKPAEVHRRLERLYGPVRRAEVFARRPVEGWHVWGNELRDENGELLQPDFRVPRRGALYEQRELGL